MYPWLVRIGYTTGASSEITYRCGGSLVSKIYVVTAAHCAALLPPGVKVAAVRVGEHNADTNPDCELNYCADPVQDLNIEKIVVNENYNNPHFKNDIAIIRLNKPVIYNENVMPICMPYGELLREKFIGEKAEVAGWGIYDIDHPQASTILQTVQLPIVPLSDCARAFRRSASVGEGQLCVGGVVGEDSCGGDSGGPLMKVESLDGPPKYYFIGLVSFGAKACGRTSTPAVYTRISDYITWILDNISP
ncbi:CLIP domain-containing serine protease B4-like isoform X2 [Diachasmimorpha longicaudata]